ncbi:MAG: sigma-70 family RNA polymerase sigma factor [Gaiellaceae bacterium MAG52_C11]|nr:sigma-70 family RNA polymerase sigma factor [Candidatus Gaiellasilicea maunaloa]
MTSETFERALRYRDSYDPARGEPAAWLIGIARRVIDDPRRRRELPVDAPEGVAEGPEEGSADRLDLQAAVALLSTGDRELVALRYGADLSARQIARVLGMKTNAVEVALHRVRTRLREALDAPAAEPDDGKRARAV